MKKFLAIAFAVLMFASVSAPAFAQDVGSVQKIVPNVDNNVMIFKKIYICLEHGMFFSSEIEYILHVLVYHYIKPGGCCC